MRLPSIPRIRPIAVVAAAGLAFTTLLAVGHLRVGYTRDESVYFEASRRYGSWLERLVDEPAAALSQKIRDRHFTFNHEHPALLKLLAGASAQVLARPPAAGSLPEKPARWDQGGGWFPWLPEGAAMRLPAQCLAGLGLVLLALRGKALGGSWFAGILAAGWFLLQPQVQFHAGLHCFDVPIAVATLAVALIYERSLSSPKAGRWLGPVLGVAIAIKHNALFLGPLLALHHGLRLGIACFRDRRRPTAAELFPRSLVLAAVTAPLVAVALWPWLWSNTVERIGEYFSFHSRHSYYNVEYFGTNFNQPPLPIEYPFVLTAATVPTGLLILSLVGLWLGLRSDRTEVRETVAGDLPKLEGSLRLVFASFPLLLIAHPDIPIFGGTKHWMTAYPFFALAAAFAWGRASEVVRSKHAAVLQACAVGLLLLPGLWLTLHAHPYGLSQYNAAVGGARGAASLGLIRGFWGHAMLPLFSEPIRDPVYLHDLHELARLQYAREGRWPGWKTGSIEHARSGLIFHERHMLSDEIRVWDAAGTRRPTAIVELDGVPLTSLYTPPGATP